MAHWLHARVVNSDGSYWHESGRGFYILGLDNGCVITLLFSESQPFRVRQGDGVSLLSTREDNVWSASEADEFIIGERLVYHRFQRPPIASLTISWSRSH